MEAIPNQAKKILIVEDEPAILRALKSVFVAEQFKTFTAENGEEGLLVALNFHPDLIILDIIMPRMNGIEMLRRIRREGGQWGKDARVIVYTNLSYNEKRDEAAAVGVKDFLVKANVSLGELVRKVKETIAQ